MADLFRKHGVGDATVYKWKAKYGGMDVSEARRLKALGDENRKLKKLLADAMLNNSALKNLLAKNGDACRDAACVGFCRNTAGIRLAQNNEAQ